MGLKTVPLAAQEENVKELPPTVTPLTADGILVSEKKEEPLPEPKKQLKVEVVPATRPSLLVRLFSCCSDAPPPDELPYLKISVRELLPDETIEKWEQRKERCNKYASNGEPAKVEKFEQSLQKKYKKQAPEKEMNPIPAKAQEAFEAATLEYVRKSETVAQLIRNLMNAGFIRRA